MNYGAAYDRYWQRADRAGTHSFDSPEPIVDHVLAAFGGGSVLDVGCGMGSMVTTMLRRGVDAFGVDVSQVAISMAAPRMPGRLLVGDVRRLPFADGSFDTIVSTDCLEHIAEPHVPLALAELFRVARRNVFLRIATRPDRDGRWHLTVRPREWWEARLIEAGFRKHPSYYDVNPYESLEDWQTDISLVYEKIDPGALARWPLGALAAERDLHMDMTRETGARSDAHLVRYQVAAQYVRPGDTVLDAACGLGYGTHLVHAKTMAAQTMGIDSSPFAVEYAKSNFAGLIAGLTFTAGDLPDWLGTQPDNSVDLAICFETLEHVAEPRRLLAEFARVLKPSGRLIGSVPNDWADDDGIDHNPFHLHVYTWPRLVEELPPSLIAEAAFAQTASRRKVGDVVRKWQPAGRSLTAMSPAAMLDAPLPDCEWWLFVYMKDPLSSKGAAYTETTFGSNVAAADWNVTAFARDYSNPWLVKAMVTIGHRLNDERTLLALATRVEQQYSPDTADAGAAFCVEGYRLLTDTGLTANIVRDFDHRVRPCLEDPGSTNPHRRRWQISLVFVLGQLWQAVGNFRVAARYFGACARLDPLDYSPLLATKTVEACERMALLEMTDGNLDAARAAFARGIALAERAIKADWDPALGDREQPVEFGLPELAAVLERASSCAYALTHFDLARQRPGVWWWQHQRDRLTRLARLETQAGMRDRAIREQGAQLGRLHGTVSSKDQALEVQATEIHRLHGVVTEKDRGLGEQSSEIHRLHAVVSEKQRALAQQSSDIQRLHTVVDDKDRQLMERASAIRQLHEALETKERSLSERDVEIRRLMDEAVTKDDAYRQASAELAAIRASRWHVLGDTLRQRPLRPRHLKRVARLGKEMVSARMGLGRRPDPPDAVASTRSDGDLHGAYVIRPPAARDQPRRRIVHALANFMTGGSSRLVVDLIERLGDRYEQFVVTSFVPSPPAYVGADVTVVRQDASDEAFTAALAAHAPVAVHVHYWGDCDEPWYRRIFDAAASLGVPILENVNTPVAPFRAASIARYVYVSDYVKREFGDPALPGEVIHPGSDFSMFRARGRGAAEPATIGMIYRLEPDKLNLDAIEPFIEVVRKRPESRVLVVGGGSLLEPYRERVRREGLIERFEFTGYVPYESLPGMYERLSVFVAPVWQESFGQVSSFAMSMGVPVVGYDVGAIPEIVDDPALVAPAGNSAALARIIIDLLDHPEARAAIATRQQQRVHALYSVEAMVSRYADIYSTLVDTPR